MIRKIFVASAIIVQAFVSAAQNSAVGAETVVLPAPDVTAIQRYGNWPMGNFTGTPHINLPLFQVTCGRLKFPVSLSYNSGGIKTNDAGSNIGMGWALNASGVINRNMMGGQVDDHPTRGYWANYPFPSSEFDGEPYLEVQRLQEYSDGLFDGQPDIFYYNAGELNGKFVFDNLQNVHTLPYTNLEIDKHIISGLTNPLTGLTLTTPIDGWTIKDENGTIYQFSDYDFNNSVPWVYKDEDITPQPYDPFPIPLSPSYIYTWRLTNIISADGKDTIHFSYDANDIVYNVYGGSAVNTAQKMGGSEAAQLPDYQKTRTVMHNQTRTKELSRISFNTGYIQFYEGTSRQDLQGGKTLDSIVQYDYKGNRLKSYRFDYLYLKDTSLISADQIPGGTAKEDIRLFLHTMQETGINGAALPPYQFTYEHSLRLPSKTMGGGDIWGMANGKTYPGIGDSLMAYAYNNLGDAQGALLFLKSPDFNYAKQGILTGVSYPTGGSSSFIYEAQYKVPQSRTYTSLVCDGNQNIEFTGVDFAPARPDDPDAPAPRKFSVSASATFDVTVTLDSRYAHFPSYYYIEIRDSATNTLKYTYYFSSVYCDTYNPSPYPTCVKHLSLTPGTYYILPKNTGTTYSGPYDDIYCKLSIPAFNCQYVSTEISDSVSVGGVRIKETIDKDPVSGKNIAKLYEYGDGVKPNLFTGSYLTETDWEYWLFFSPNTDSDLSEHQKILSSNSTYPLTDVSGFYVCYGNVKETEMDLNTGKTNGYTINYYNNDIDDGLHEGDFSMSPYPPYVGQSWKRGKLLRTTIYKTTDDNQSIPVQDKIMNYSNLKEKGRIYGDAFFTFLHLFQGSDWAYFLDSADREYVSPKYVSHKTFYYTSSYNVLDSTTVKDYDDSGHIVSTKTIYQYDTTTLLPKNSSVSTTKGEWITTNYTRPFDYSGLTGSNTIVKGIKMLQDVHALAPEIETTVSRANRDGANKRVLESVFTSYKPDKPLRDKIYTTEEAGIMTDFTPAAISAGSLTMDSRYTPKVSFDAYDGFNNLARQHKVGDMNMAYIWDYQYGYPIALVLNATDTNIAYTSFEADGAGNWTIGSAARDSSAAITGRTSYSLSAGAISKSGLNSAAAYIVSYWSRNGSCSITGTLSGYPKAGKHTTDGWTYYEHKITSQTSVTLSGSGMIDELRLYPASAQMTTYTFDPLIGMTSQADVASRITYYEYDGLQRLKRIRDQDRNILKSYDYQYQTPGGCGSNCVVLSMTGFAGRGLHGYPVGVFNIHNRLLGNAAGPSQFASRWNSDAANAAVGTLSAAADSLHFNLALNSGQTAPATLTARRFYQYDIAWNQFDGVRNYNGSYVDFGDGTGMPLGSHADDTSIAIAPNTGMGLATGFDYFLNVPLSVRYFYHTYPDSSLKTVTFYHDDLPSQGPGLDNWNIPATTLIRVKNLRGTLPQNLTTFGFSSYQDSTASSVARIANWNEIQSVISFGIGNGGGEQIENVGYTQDFMKNNAGLQQIVLGGLSDPNFKVSRLKSDWNTYFTGLQWLEVSDDNWDREDLSALHKLHFLRFFVTKGGGSAIIDTVLNQIAAGAGPTVSNGAIFIAYSGFDRTSASAAAFTLLKSKGWVININGVAE